MARQQDWDKSNLADFLLLDSWKPYNAFRVLAGFKYHSPEYEFDPDSSLDGSVGYCGGWEPTDVDLCYLEKMKSIEARLTYFWEEGIGHGGRIGENKPRDFIEWAISKKCRPDWLDWAIEHGYYGVEWGNTPKESGALANPAPASVEEAPPTTQAGEQAANNRTNHDITKERGSRRLILENWDDIEKRHGAVADGRQVHNLLKRKVDASELPTLKTVQNKLKLLRDEKLIP